MAEAQPEPVGIYWSLHGNLHLSSQTRAFTRVVNLKDGVEGAAAAESGETGSTSASEA
jgi:hypothetical protein